MSDSIISRSFQVNPLSKLPKDFVPADGMRLCRVIFKQSRAEKDAGKAKKDSQYCQLPLISSAFAQAFILNQQGLELVQDYLAGLQDKVVRKVWIDSNRSPCETDLSIEAMIAAGQAEVSEGFRLSAKLIETVFDSDFRNQIAAGLALTRDADFLVLMNDESRTAEQIAAYWNSEAGMKFQQTAANYKKFFVRGAERAPTFETQAIKDKIVAALEYCEDSPVLSRIAEKLQNAPIASVDDSGL